MLSPRAFGFICLVSSLSPWIYPFTPELQCRVKLLSRAAKLSYTSQFTGLGGGRGLWSFHFWKHCVTLISADTVFSPLSVSLIRTCSPLGRAGLCKVTSWQSVLTGKHPEDVNRLGKPERDFSEDERDKKRGMLTSQNAVFGFVLLLLRSAATCQQV